MGGSSSRKWIIFDDFVFMAPDVYRFRLWHAELGCVDGMVFYLPCRDGIEKSRLLKLHEAQQPWFSGRAAHSLRQAHTATAVHGMGSRGEAASE